jgi:hypothetical protein
MKQCERAEVEVAFCSRVCTTGSDEGWCKVHQARGVVSRPGPRARAKLREERRDRAAKKREKSAVYFQGDKERIEGINEILDEHASNRYIPVVSRRKGWRKLTAGSTPLMSAVQSLRYLTF